MKDITVNIIFFSPTRTSAKIAESIGEGIDGKHIIIDLTYTDEDSCIEIKDSLAIIVMPVHKGKVSSVGLQRLQRLKGSNTPTILAVTYGNRDYECALSELKNTALQLGFRPLSAGAFVGEHSYSTSQYPIAEGRPDSMDLQTARQLGIDSWRKLMEDTDWGELYLPVCSSHLKNSVAKPLPQNNLDVPVCLDNCITCGYCIDKCPMGAIGFDDEGNNIVTDKNLCIHCCACVKECPNKARLYETPFSKFLHENFHIRKEPILFL